MFTKPSGSWYQPKSCIRLNWSELASDLLVAILLPIHKPTWGPYTQSWTNISKNMSSINLNLCSMSDLVNIHKQVWLAALIKAGINKSLTSSLYPVDLNAFFWFWWNCVLLLYLPHCSNQSTLCSLQTDQTCLNNSPSNRASNWQ